MSSNKVPGKSRLSQVFSMRPERIASAWRRVCWVQRREKDGLNLLDSIVESFVREIGHRLAGVEGSAWSRTSGVLRLSRQRGVHGLHNEFSALQKCLLDAASVLSASQREREQITHSISEAFGSASAELAALQNVPCDAKRVPFGGLIVELFERTEERAPAAQMPAAVLQ